MLEVDDGFTNRKTRHALQKLAERRHVRLLQAGAIILESGTKSADAIWNPSLTLARRFPSMTRLEFWPAFTTLHHANVDAAGRRQPAIGMRIVSCSPFSNGTGTESTEVYPGRIAAIW